MNFSFLVAILRIGCVLIFLLGSTGCISVQGKSTREIKSEFQGSYLYKSVKRYYPDGLPEDPGIIYPALKGAKLPPIKDEMNQFAAAIRAAHVHRRPYIEKYLHYIVPKIAKSDVEVVSRGIPSAFTKNGNIYLDVLVLQAIFRGALLSADMTFISEESFAVSELPSAYSPDQETQAQRQKLGWLLDSVKTVDSSTGTCAIIDVFRAINDFDSPWFKLSSIQLATQNLQFTYAGAILFLLAHEHGHIALDHDAVALTLSKEDSEYCQKQRELELQADAYALLLLSPYVGQQAMPPAVELLMGPVTGYRSFFEYGYRLGGFKDPGANCTYPSKEVRLQNLSELDRALAEKNAEAFDATILKALQSSH